MNLTEIEARMQKIAEELETRSGELTSEDIARFSAEIDELKERKANLIRRQEDRQRILDDIAANGAQRQHRRRTARIPQERQTNPANRFAEPDGRIEDRAVDPRPLPADRARERVRGLAVSGQPFDHA